MALGTGALADTREAQRMRCLDWMDRGYPSGLEEQLCRSEFSLPSAYLVKCGRALKRGFASDLERQACARFLAHASARAASGYLIPPPSPVPQQAGAAATGPR